MTDMLILLSLLLISNCVANTIPDESGPRMVTRINHRNESYVLMAHESDKGTFAEAEARCSVIGSMVWIRDDADQQFVRSLVGGHRTWLGCQFTQGLLTSRKLTITDTLSRESNYENWEQNEPRCSVFGECCAIMMDERGKWFANPCTGKGHILCRVKRSFQAEAQKLIEETKNAIVANGGTVPPEYATSDRPADTEFREILSNLTQRVSIMEKQILEIASRSAQTTDDRFQQAILHSDQNYQNLSSKMVNMTNDFKAAIDNLTKLMVKRTG